MEQWVIVNLQGEYLKKVINSLSEEYTTDLSQALKFGSKRAAQKECDVFEGVRQIS
ncbi:hypothetical protein [Paenibacillus sp. IHBB 3054]|uniref:hypothetical protein n=1 Tax=Paenibacillus sp. IHBB 3054 TaxID=3425689 RepID=UPI003F6637DE